jgi:MFS family permease
LQTLLIPATQGLVFFGVFARREFSLDVKALGLLLVSDALAPLIGNAVWGRFADRAGNRRVLLGAALAGIAAPALALLLMLGGGRGELSPPLVLGAFSAIVFTVSVASTGADLASKNFILELAPSPGKRPVYIGMNDTLVAIPTTALAGAGLIIDAFGFSPVFIGIVLCSALAAWLALRLPRL